MDRKKSSRVKNTLLRLSSANRGSLTNYKDWTATLVWHPSAATPGHAFLCFPFSGRQTVRLRPSLPALAPNEKIICFQSSYSFCVKLEGYGVSTCCTPDAPAQSQTWLQSRTRCRNHYQRQEEVMLGKLEWVRRKGGGGCREIATSVLGGGTQGYCLNSTHCI